MIPYAFLEIAERDAMNARSNYPDAYDYFSRNVVVVDNAWRFCDSDYEETKNTLTYIHEDIVRYALEFFRFGLEETTFPRLRALEFFRFE